MSHEQKKKKVRNRLGVHSSPKEVRGRTVDEPDQELPLLCPGVASLKTGMARGVKSQLRVDHKHPEMWRYRMMRLVS